MAMLTAAIQTCRARLDLALGLYRELAWGVTVEIVQDPEEDGAPNPWRCYRHCLATTPPGTTHRLILQDDVTLAIGFVAAAWQVANANPDRLVALFWGGHRDENLMILNRAHEAGERYAVVTPRRFVQTVAVLWPVRLIQPVLDWVDEQDFPPAFRSDDEIVGRACTDLNITVAATVPSLVEHEDMVASTIGRRHEEGRDPARVALRWLRPPDDARSLAWL